MGTKKKGIELLALLEGLTNYIWVDGCLPKKISFHHILGEYAVNFFFFFNLKVSVVDFSFHEVINSVSTTVNENPQREQACLLFVLANKVYSNLPLQ